MFPLCDWVVLTGGGSIAQGTHLVLIHGGRMARVLKGALHDLAHRGDLRDGTRLQALYRLVGIAQRRVQLLQAVPSQPYQPSSREHRPARWFCQQDN